MTFTLTYAKNTAQCELFPGQKLRLWAVPTAYSDDGLVVAVWGSGELEPCPACLGTDMELLAEYECRHDYSASTGGGGALGASVYPQV